MQPPTPDRPERPVVAQRLPGRLPGLYCIQTDANGERKFLYWRNEAAVRDCFTTPAAEPVLAALPSYDVVYFSGITLAVLGEVGRMRLLQALIETRQRGGKVVWFDFRELCDKPLSQNDYLELAAMFQTIIVSDVPHMQVSMASMARRFTLLVDVLYDRRVKLVISAAVAPEALYTEGTLAHEFVRTVSRLHEMQSAEYQALEHRHVDSSIT